MYRAGAAEAVWSTSHPKSGLRPAAAAAAAAAADARAAPGGPGSALCPTRVLGSGGEVRASCRRWSAPHSAPCGPKGAPTQVHKGGNAPPPLMNLHQYAGADEYTQRRQPQSAILQCHASAARRPWDAAGSSGHGSTRIPAAHAALRQHCSAVVAT